MITASTCLASACLFLSIATMVAMLFVKERYHFKLLMFQLIVSVIAVVGYLW